MIYLLQTYGFKRTDFDNGVQFLVHKGKKLDAWHDLKSLNTMVGRINGRDNKVFKGNQDKQLSQYLQKKFKIKSSENQWNESKLRNAIREIIKEQLNEASFAELYMKNDWKTKKVVSKIIKQLRLKIDKDYDVKLVGSSGQVQKFFILPKHRDKFLELLMKNRIKVRG